MKIAHYLGLRVHEELQLHGKPCLFQDLIATYRMEKSSVLHRKVLHL